MAVPDFIRMAGIFVPYILLLVTLAHSTYGQGTNIPVFTNITALDNRNLPENFPVGSVLGKISAYDPDGNAVTYDILENGGEYFNIDKNTGVVSLKKSLDFETEIEIRFVLVVTDATGQIARRDGKAFVSDENDNIPLFADTAIFRNLTENTPVGTVITPISVSDRDTKNSPIDVYCAANASGSFQDACNTFKLEKTSNSNKDWRGNLVLQKALDYELRIAYNIRLIATDGLLNSTNEVHIEVQDVNDSPPRWTTAGPANTDEENSIGTSIQQVKAEDSDLTNKRQIHYELIGNYTNVFQINSTTGVISNAIRLDYDADNFPKGIPYELTIKAREEINRTALGNDPLSTSTVAIKITVQDINDNGPVFINAPYSRYCVDENIASGANVPGLQMTVRDIDSGTFNSFDLTTLDYKDTFGIIPEADAATSSATLFVIDSSKIDYETGPREYVIPIRAIENKVSTGIHTGSATVTICINDVNDITPDFDSDSYTRSVIEDAQPGTVIIDLDATDIEAGNFGSAGIRYKLYGNIPPHFTIDEITGVVRVGPCNPPGKPGVTPCIDYEKKTSYVLTVSATDNLGTGRSRSTQLIIDVGDVNDNIPRIDTSYVRYINEGETKTINPLWIEPIDPDTVGGPLSFRLESAPLWQITSMRNPSTGRLYGEITAIRPILYTDTPEGKGEFNFAAVVEDKQFSNTASVKIIVLDINNNEPRFISDNFRTQIPETTTGDVFVMKVTASDLDAPTTGNGVIDFYIDSGANGKFSIANVTLVGNNYVGDVFTTHDATFNYDTQKSYDMVLRCQDRGSPNSLHSTARLIVDILDVNNKDPVIYPSFASITVLETAPVGYSVYKINARDPDVTSILKYYMNPAEATDGLGRLIDRGVFDFTHLFRLDENTGDVLVNGSLDRDIVSRITYNLNVKDVSTTPVQEGNGTLMIYILEVNDQAPQFDFPLYNITIDEELNINSFVLSLNCHDQDDRISSYSIIQQTPSRPMYFEFVQGSGALIVNNRIDYEQLEHIELVASCTDTGSPPLSNTTRVIVNIRNINDNTPVFDQPVYRFNVTENSNTGSLGNIPVHATDIDKGDYGVVRYTLDDKHGFFEIDNTTGNLSIHTSAKFDRETASSIDFFVVAYDSPNNASVRRSSSVPVFVIIGDQNDNCPQFLRAPYRGIVPESADMDTDIIDIMVTDADVGVNSEVVFGIKSGSGQPPEAEMLFGIGVESGRVLVKGNLKNKQGLYNFNVTATDMKGTNPALQCTNEAQVTIEVQESDNDAPRWVKPPNRDYAIYVLESQYDGMFVYRALAYDNNTGPSGVVDYYFYLNDQFVSNTPEFRINRVTGVIRAEIVYDREQKNVYYLNLMARDQGNPSSSSETTLIVIILDVNDNDPKFPMKNGTVTSLELDGVSEDQTVPVGGLKLGYCTATDADSDVANNKIYYELLDVGNQIKDYIRIDNITCDIFLIKKPDYESFSTLEFDILAYNVKNNDVVKREKREANPSIQHVIVHVGDANDNPPVFTQQEYFGCISIDAPYRQSILEVEATDKDVGDESRATYSIERDECQAFYIDSLGVIYNDISLRQVSKTICSFSVSAVEGASSKAQASVTVFVTSPSNIVKLKVNRPLTDVEPFKQQLAKTLKDSSGGSIAFACVQDMKNHVGSDGSQTSLATDVYVAAVMKNNNGQYSVYNAEELVNFIESQRNKPDSQFNAIYVTNVEADSPNSADGLMLEEDAVIAIMIICILLIFLALLLLIIACICIRNSKRKETEKIRAEQHTIVHVSQEPVETSFNPVYDNNVLVAQESPPSDEYATVQKKLQSSGRSVGPMVIVQDEPEYLVPEEPTRSWIMEEPEPVIEAELEPESPVIREPEPLEYRPFEPEYEDRIETEVQDDYRPPTPPTPPASALHFYPDDDGDDDDDNNIDAEVISQASTQPPPPEPVSEFEPEPVSQFEPVDDNASITSAMSSQVVPEPPLLLAPPMPSADDDDDDIEMIIRDSLPPTPPRTYDSD